MKRHPQGAQPQPTSEVSRPEKQEPSRFSEEGLRNVVGLAEILHRVHARLVAEGYELNNGHLVKRDGIMESDGRHDQSV